jgi:hypothetical protein
MRLLKSGVVLFILSLFFFITDARIAFSQVDQGTISGVVQDTTGAVIPGAQVTLTNVGTTLSLHTKSDASGLFSFPPAKVGNYRLAAAAPGFSRTLHENIHLDVQGKLNISLTLAPGATSDTVTVTAAPSLLQTQSGAVGQVISTDTINNTPLNGRNWVYIVQLTAGVVPSGGTHGGGTGDFSANGQRAGQNNFLMDGVDNNANIMDLMNGASYNVRPPPDALSEFRVDTADYSAELGHSAGAAVNVSIKSGTNQIHGDLWEYFRNTDLDAKNWNSPINPAYHENQFGATLGLPILKNHLFFFGDVEANRVTYGGAATYLSVPTPLMRQGNFTELSNTSLTGSAKPTQLYEPNSAGATLLTCNGVNNTFCPSQINPIAQKVLNMYPLPNTNNGDTYNNYVENLTDINNTFQWDTRLDWNIRATDQAFVRLSYANIRGNVPGPLGPILNGATSYSSGLIDSLIENVAASETHIFNTSLFNEFRFGVNYGHFSFLQPGFNTNVAAQLGFGGIPYGPGFPDNGGLPEVTVGGISGFGSYDYDPSVEAQNGYQIIDNVTKVLRGHTLKFGVNFQALRVSALQPPKSRGNYDFSGYFTGNQGASYTGSGIADFLADQMASASLTNETTIDDVSWYRSGYAQDDWRVSQALTFNFGLRYDYYQPPRENSGRQANFNVTGPLGIGTGVGTYYIPAESRGTALPAAFQSVLQQSNINVQYVSNAALVNPRFTNFAPRIGFAFSPNHKTVINGGFGIFYGGLEEVGVGPNMGLNSPFGYSDSFTRPTCVVGNCQSIPETIETGFSVPLAAGLGTYVSQPSLQGTPADSKTTSTTSYNLQVQRSIMPNLLASAAYVGNSARHLVTNFGFDSAEALQNPSNTALATEPFPLIGGGTIVMYTGQSNYNSLQAKLEKRFSSGLSFLSTYTWAHALDDSYDPLAGGVSDRNINLIPISYEYTHSPYDVRQRVTFNGFYELPFGKGRQHTIHEGWLDALAGGWATSLTFTAETGKPLSVSTNISTATGGTARAIKIRNPFTPGGTPDPSNPDASCPTHVHNKTNWYNPCAFANPLPGADIPKTGAGSQVTGLTQALAYLGGRANVVPGPGYERVNLSAFKDFSVWRETQLEFRADAFNLLNTPSYSVSTTSDGPTGGLINGTQSFQSNTPDARFFQLSAKYKF